MAIVVAEKFGRRGGKNRRERVYYVSGTDDDTEAFDAMIDEAPSAIDDLTIDEDASDIDEIEGLEGFIGVVRYTVPSFTRLDVTEERRGLTVTARTQHVTHALAHVSSYGDDPKPDHGGAINVTADGVDGVDIYAGNGTIPIIRRFDTDDLTTAYQETVVAAVGSVNDATFRGFAAGELLLYAANIPPFGDDDTEVDVEFTFLYSANAANLTVGTITNITKKGWDYLWVEYATEDDGNGHLVKQAKHVHVEQVYPSADFSTLIPAS